MTLIDASLHAIGGFYVFAGVVGARAAVANRTLDGLISAIETSGAAPSGDAAGARQAQHRAESLRSHWLLAGSLAVLVSGAALVLRLDDARWVFLAAALLQAVYLFHVAPMHLDGVDPVDAVGRRQTMNAFVLFAAATAYVFWAGWRGRLLSLAGVDRTLLMVAALLLAAFVGHTLWSYIRPLPAAGDERP